jgi:DNA-binding transcriptional regulator YiaG
MTTLAIALKNEIRRLSRKEVKVVTGSATKAVAKYRRDIAALKRQCREHEKQIAFLRAQEHKRLENQEVCNGAANGTRFSAKSVRSQRKRIGLSAADYAKLVGVSPLSIYHWEQGKTRPRKEQITRLAGLRGIGKREALKKLELLAHQPLSTNAVTRRRGRRAK